MWGNSQIEVNKVEAILHHTVPWYGMRTKESKKKPGDQEPEESRVGAEGSRRKQESPWRQGVSKRDVVMREGESLQKIPDS